MLEDMLKTDLLSEKPNTCFVSPLFSDDFPLMHKGIESKISNLKNSSCLLEVNNLNKLKSKIIIKNFVLIIAFALIIPLFGMLFKVGDSFLPAEPGFWKFMVLQFSIMSVLLFGFSECFESHFVKKEWAQRCIANASIIKTDKKKKCSLDIAKKDLTELFLNSNISFKNEYCFPQGNSYFKCVNNEINKITFKGNIFLEYNRLLPKINASPNVLKSIFSILLGFFIEVFTFLDVYDELQLFMTNLLLSAIIICIMSLLLSYQLISSKYEKTVIKFDALLYLYSYMYLDMPFLADKEKCTVLNIEKEPQFNANNKFKNEYEIEAMLEHRRSKLINDLHHYIYYRLLVLDGNLIRVYGVK